MTFGSRLRELRERAGLTTYALAKRAGVAVQQVDHLEKKPGAMPRLDTALKLAGAIGVSVEALVGNGGEKKSRKKS